MHFPLGCVVPELDICNFFALAFELEDTALQYIGGRQLRLGFPARLVLFQAELQGVVLPAETSEIQRKTNETVEAVDDK